MKNSTLEANRLASRNFNRTPRGAPDFELSHHGTISLFLALSDRANEWLRRHCPPDRDHQYLGKALAIEHRYVKSIVCFAINDGLVQTTN